MFFLVLFIFTGGLQTTVSFLLYQESRCVSYTYGSATLPRSFHPNAKTLQTLGMRCFSKASDNAPPPKKSSGLGEPFFHSSQLFVSLLFFFFFFSSWFLLLFFPSLFSFFFFLIFFSCIFRFNQQRVVLWEGSPTFWPWPRQARPFGARQAVHVLKNGSPELLKAARAVIRGEAGAGGRIFPDLVEPRRGFWVWGWCGVGVGAGVCGVRVCVCVCGHSQDRLKPTLWGAFNKTQPANLRVKPKLPKLCSSGESAGEHSFKISDRSLARVFKRCQRFSSPRVPRGNSLRLDWKPRHPPSTPQRVESLCFGGPWIFQKRGSNGNCFHPQIRRGSLVWV